MCCCLEARAQPNQASGSFSGKSTCHPLVIKWETQWYRLWPVNPLYHLIRWTDCEDLNGPVWFRCFCGRWSVSVFRPSSIGRSCGESSCCSAASGPFWRGSTLSTWDDLPVSSRWDVAVGSYWSLWSSSCIINPFNNPAQQSFFHPSFEVKVPQTI